MSLIAAKRDVTRYFKRRKAELALISKARVSASDDFFELYVLSRIVAGTNATMENTQRRKNRQHFVVAGSPSNNWHGASYFKVGSHGIRTGLQVKCADGHEAELDVVIVDLARVSGGLVGASAIDAAIECKAFEGKLQLAQAVEAIGKAVRVWRLLLLPPIGKGPATTGRYALVGLNGSAGSVRDVLEAHGIELCDDDAQLSLHTRKLRSIL
jgi:hypothetical protein